MIASASCVIPSLPSRFPRALSPLPSFSRFLGLDVRRYHQSGGRWRSCTPRGGTYRRPSRTEPCRGGSRRVCVQQHTVSSNCAHIQRRPCFRTHPPRKAPSGLLGGRGVESARRRADVLKVRIAAARVAVVPERRALEAYSIVSVFVSEGKRGVRVCPFVA